MPKLKTLRGRLTVQGFACGYVECWSADATLFQPALLLRMGKLAHGSALYVSLWNDDIQQIEYHTFQHVGKARAYAKGLCDTYGLKTTTTEYFT